MSIEKRILLAALGSGLLCSCSEPLDDRFPGPLEPVTDLDCNNGVAEPPLVLRAIDGWGIDAGWESRVRCDHRHSHGYVDVSLPGNVCLGLNREVGAMVAHTPVADGPGTYTVKFAAQTKHDQLIDVILSRGTDDESPDWARSVSVELECFQPCDVMAQEKTRLCRPVVRFHDLPELDLETTPKHERYQALAGHSAEDHEIKCALNEEFGFPLPTTATVSAEIIVEGRSVGWKIDGALVSGFGPAYQVDRSRWSCERPDGTPMKNAPQRMFVVGLPFAEEATSPNQPGYELTIEHWSPEESSCANAPPSASEAHGAWMCVRDARYASCSGADCAGTCGDGTCDIWETCSTCKTDCNICGPKVPDLKFASILCGKTVNNDGPFSCNIVIANQGTGDSGEFEYQVWLSSDPNFSSADKVLVTCKSSSIAAGATSSMTCDGVIPYATGSGTWYLGFVADSSDAVSELDENNNFEFGPITVISDYVAPTDLTISSMECFTLIIGTGEEVECLVTIDNVGGIAAGPFLVDLVLSKDTIINGFDTLLSSCQVFGVPGGTSYPMTCAGKIPLGTFSGNYYLGAIVDNLNAVPESNESNNSGHDSNFISIHNGPADLVVTSLTCPSTANSPGTIQCSVTVKNQGDSVANFVKNELFISDNTTLDSFLDKSLGTCDVPLGLAAGQSQTMMCSGNIPSGIVGFSKYIIVETSCGGVIAELDEKNNTAYKSVTIQQGQADLVVTSINCPSFATSPGSIQCSVTIKNQGNTTANFIKNEMYISDNAALDFFDKSLGTCNGPSTLSSGQSQMITCSGNIPSGIVGFSKYIIVETDSTSSVSESNENNNTGSRNITIQ